VKFLDVVLSKIEREICFLNVQVTLKELGIVPLLRSPSEVAQYAAFQMTVIKVILVYPQYFEVG